ncbi:hypothetical protein H3V42_31170 (plasmid) [Sphingobium yanoikuyae]|uniref:Uncharacterized protein n=1 Tax=Sphingobium yanoikuyae TaxID=13690 RepID=A0A9X7UI22_SPHYA|nr:hypothetical protein H3V42_31170 [Sphingobium yanoikuyae]
MGASGLGDPANPVLAAVEHGQSVLMPYRFMAVTAHAFVLPRLTGSDWLLSTASDGFGKHVGSFSAGSRAKPPNLPMMSVRFAPSPFQN